MSAPVTILTGGIGGAKLVLGARDLLPPGMVTAIVNTGDDFTHLGLSISPDIDTLLYTLAGLANRTLGWGREGESWNFMAALKSLGGPDWFQLGDGDLAVHLLRTMRLSGGEPLSAITADMAAVWQAGARILPMSDDPVRTMIDSDEGELAFQQYFVGRRAEPEVRAIRFTGADTAQPAPGVVEAITNPAASAILIAPSNPFLSVDPLLAVPGIRAALQATPVPVVAVSPLVGGEAVKGPTARLMMAFGLPTDATAIARHYDGLIDAILIDARDAPIDPGIPHARADTLMHNATDRMRVAEAALALAATL